MVLGLLDRIKDEVAKFYKAESWLEITLLMSPSLIVIACDEVARRYAIAVGEAVKHEIENKAFTADTVDGERDIIRLSDVESLSIPDIITKLNSK